MIKWWDCRPTLQVHRYLANALWLSLLPAVERQTHEPHDQHRDGARLGDERGDRIDRHGIKAAGVKVTECCPVDVVSPGGQKGPTRAGGSVLAVGAVERVEVGAGRNVDQDRAAVEGAVTRDSSWRAPRVRCRRRR